MEKLTDYIRWVGDLDFCAYPFREADALILCNISYFDLTPVFADGNPTHPLSDCLPMIETGEVKLMVTGGDLGNGEILKAAAQSARYGSLLLSDYEDRFRADPPLQFSAVTVHAPDFSLIAYRGTDASLAGWRESCMLSFTHTEAQELALAYAERMIDDGAWILCGHSKGANEAQYTACLLSDDKWEKVRHVYLLDGPGFCPELRDESLEKRIDPKTTRIIPEYDVIGKLYEPHFTDTKIVRSDHTGIMQHSLATWLIKYGALSTVPQNDPESEQINYLVNDWIENVPPEHRSILVDDLFRAFSADGTKNLEELDLDRIESIVIRLTGVSPTSRKVLSILPNKLLFDDAVPALPQSKTEKLKRLLADLRVQGVGLLLSGVLLFLLSGFLFELTAVIIVTALAAVQTALLIRRLIRQHGKFDNLRTRFVFLIVILALAASLYFREHAMFLISSVLYGILCLAISYNAVRYGVKCKDKPFLRVLSFVEGALAGLFGIGFLVIPKSIARPFTITLAIFVAVSGLMRLGYRVAQYCIRRKRKTV